MSEGDAIRCGGPDDVRCSMLVVRERTLELAACYEAALGPKLEVPQRPTLNPPRWELGHIAWFQQWWIERNPERALGHRADPQAPRRASDLPTADEWFDSSTVPHAARWSLPLPSIGGAREWLGSTQARTLALLACLPADADGDALYFFRLACLHEAMHAEAWVYMARSLGIEVPVAAAPAWRSEATLAIAAQPWTAGWAGGGFGFDNEMPAHSVPLAAFEIDAEPVSWRRYAGFVAEGGYDERRWWSDEGWEWRARSRPARPEFPEDDRCASHLSAHEAEAWCQWSGRRLPTEFEWECAAMTQPGFDWGAVWEWTASPFVPFAGFEPHPYRDYSQPWFNQRRVLRGASVATPACLRHARFRNFFTPDRTDVIAGFRSCVRAPENA